MRHRGVPHRQRAVDRSIVRSQVGDATFPCHARRRGPHRGAAAQPRLRPRAGQAPPQGRGPRGRLGRGRRGPPPGRASGGDRGRERGGDRRVVLLRVRRLLGFLRGAARPRARLAGSVEGGLARRLGGRLAADVDVVDVVRACVARARRLFFVYTVSRPPGGTGTPAWLALGFSGDLGLLDGDDAHAPVERGALQITEARLGRAWAGKG